MKFSFSSVFVLATAALATSVTYDTGYDESGTSLTQVACSDGTHGLIPKGFSTYGSLPNFPYIGGSSDIAGWNSANCGNCYKVTYEDKSVYILAIDHTDDGINMSLEAMDELTDGQAEFLGQVAGTVTKVAASNCGF